MMREFDWTTAPLSGKSLIEASAGTGKTFMISRIYLRLLLERKLPVQEILVVTFTDAATNELKERIHKTLIMARDGFLGYGVEDVDLQKYITSYKSTDSAREQLTIALQDFDEASVFTIHTFCNRVLQENAFESGGMFDAELVTEQTGLLNEAVEDFWRQKIYTQSGMFLSYALAEISPEKLYKFVEKNIGRLSFKIIPESIEGETETKQLENEFSDSFFKLKASWKKCGDEVKDLLINHGGLNGTVLNREVLIKLLGNMDIYTRNASADLMLFKNFDRLSQSYLVTKTNKSSKKPSPEHSYFEICEEHFELHQELAAAFDACLIDLKKELFVFVRAELKRKKEARNIFYYDDLLLNLHAALSEGSQSLAETVRSKFKAALIDEFQDTDSVQYNIFSSIFDHPGATLFLIGDPKQAIYGFRGADIFAYMKARRSANENARFTLRTNYRSEPGLIQAVNHIFNATDNAFIYPEIPFHDAVAAEIPNRPELKIPGESPSPLQLWFYDPEENTAAAQKNSKALIADAVADEIVRLLELGKSGQATIDNLPLEEKDIAVLVRTHSESKMVQQALRRRNVHSVLYTTDNLFASHEALELERVLLAVAAPKSVGKMKAALSTEMFGLNANAILQLDEEGDALEEWLDRFAAYHQSWRDFGFVRMINDLFKQERLLTHLMAFEDGERRITNLLHLSDILNENAIKNQLGINGLLKWLTEQRTLLDKSIEEHQIRLESDEDAVKLITMHMSKGLQFPIVFCPFAWGASTIRKKETLKFHDENDELNFTIDLGSSGPERELHKAMAEKEQLAENLRLLYVAITRARNRCYLVWGDLSSRNNPTHTSALAYLFHKPKPFDESNPVEVLKKHLNKEKTDTLFKQVETLAAHSNGTIALEKLLPTQVKRFSTNIESNDKLRNKKFTAAVDTRLRISSYSGLVSKHPHGAELADYDALEISVKSEPMEIDKTGGEFNDFMSFPRGSKAGTFLHDLLQQLDFQDTQNEATSVLVFEKLREFGFDTKWQGVIVNMFDRLMKLNLKNPSEQFTLAEIDQTHCMKELEFYFPVQMLSPQKLRTVFEKHGDGKAEFIEKLRQINFSEFKGFMKGFIDLIIQKNGWFYIIDWKSNYLGTAFKNYDESNLAQEMSARLYVLQYHLYTLALNNYLNLRLPDYDYEKHFGGVVYIFMRGVEPEKAPDCGIYFDRPSEKLIDELAKTMMGKSQ